MEAGGGWTEALDVVHGRDPHGESYLFFLNEWMVSLRGRTSSGTANPTHPLFFFQLCVSVSSYFETSQQMYS